MPGRELFFSKGAFFGHNALAVVEKSRDHGRVELASGTFFDDGLAVFFR